MLVSYKNTSAIVIFIIILIFTHNLPPFTSLWCRLNMKQMLFCKMNTLTNELLLYKTVMYSCVALLYLVVISSYCLCKFQKCACQCHDTVITKLCISSSNRNDRKSSPRDSQTFTALLIEPSRCSNVQPEKCQNNLMSLDLSVMSTWHQNGTRRSLWCLFAESSL